MSTNNSLSDGVKPSRIQSVSSGGESVTLDTNALKEDEREERNSDLTNIANRQVRPYFFRVKIRSPYG